MANPQAENGHIDIAHEIIEALARIRLSGEETQCLWVILRKTYGWKKKEDKISLSQFACMTGLKKQHVHRALLKLSSKMVIGITKNGDSILNSYRFNKDFDKWIPSPKKVIPSPNLVKGVTKNGKRPSPKMVNTKENYTKETITKEIYLEIVSYLNEKTGKSFKYQSKETQALIRARWNSGFRIPDFKTVVDNMSAKWKTDEKMVDYLRPQTLFGTKFEAYLNVSKELDWHEKVRRAQ